MRNSIAIGIQQIKRFELESKLGVYEHLAQAADDIKLGRVQDMDDAFNDILSELLYQETKL